MMSADKQNGLAGERFDKDTADHQMTVLLDHGLYRHLLFRDPRRSFYWFEILTSPGLLTLNGDMGTYVFSRESDMFGFFRAGRFAARRINPGYWAEKIKGGTSGGRATVQEFCHHKYVRLVTEYAADMADDMPPATRAAFGDEVKEFLEDLPYNETHAIQQLMDFEFVAADGKKYEFNEPYEWGGFKDYTVQFLWSCHAIVSGITQYDTMRADPTRAAGAHA